MNRHTMVVGALLAVIVFGLFVFAFTAAADFLGGFGGPTLAFQLYPLLAKMYQPFEVGGLAPHSQMGIEGFLGFCVATLSFMALRRGQSFRTAAMEGLLLFAAPVLVIFELGLWYYLPYDMYWHVADFVPWSVGDIYLVSNYVVLYVSCILLVVGLNWKLSGVAGMNRTYRAIFVLESCAALFMLAVALQPPPYHLATWAPTVKGVVH